MPGQQVVDGVRLAGGDTLQAFRAQTAVQAPARLGHGHFGCVPEVDLRKVLQPLGSRPFGYRYAGLALDFALAEFALSLFARQLWRLGFRGGLRPRRALQAAMNRFRGLVTPCPSWSSLR